MILEELNKVSDLISELIKNDDFPEKIEPVQLRDAVTLYPMRPGKRLRPALVMWCCGLFNGDVKQAEYAAAAVEVYHNWTLVHDDIIDEDELRRGLPATHTVLEMYARDNFHVDKKKAKKFGSDLAILAGDLQHAWAMNFLLKLIQKGVSPSLVTALCRNLCEMLSRELVSGEALDVDFSYRNFEKITPEEVERIIYLKTGALLNYSATTGAKIALKIDNLQDKRLQKITDFATAVGTAFQLRDDWLGIFGETESFGKPLGSDICSAKPTILILNTLRNLNKSDSNILLSYVGSAEISSGELMKIRSLIIKSGAEKDVLERSNNLRIYAKNSLSGFPDNKYKKLLLELNDYLINRNR
jgi:geranylgeranyl diphosphate synthase, type I